MTFAWPAALLGLVAIPLAAAWYVVVTRRRSRYPIVFPNVDVLASVTPRGRGTRRAVPVVLFALAATALIVGLARPQARVLIPRDDATVVLVIDRSGSMQTSDVEPTRLDAARDAALAFMRVVPSRFRLGLVAFSSTADVLAEPTTRRGRVRDGLDTLRATGGTAIGDALLKAVHLVADDTTPPRRGEAPLSAVLLLSDGASTSGADPLAAAAVAQRAGVPVFTVALGAEDDSGFLSLLGSDAPDRTTLRAIAETTGGRFFDAPTQEDLTQIYRDLGSRLGFEWDRREVTAAFAFAGAVLFLVAAFTSFKRRPRLP